MTAARAAREADGNGIPRPVIKWFRATFRPFGTCEDCGWHVAPADLAVARMHVKSHPSHHVTLSQVNRTDVYAETTDGVDWAEAVRDA